MAEVRLDVADGSLDGFADVVSVEKKGAQAKTNTEYITMNMLKKATNNARKKFKAERGHVRFTSHRNTSAQARLHILFLPGVLLAKLHEI